MQRNIKQISESGLTFCQLIFLGVMLQDRKGGFWGLNQLHFGMHTHFICFGPGILASRFPNFKHNSKCQLKVQKIAPQNWGENGAMMLYSPSLSLSLCLFPILWGNIDG